MKVSHRLIQASPKPGCLELKTDAALYRLVLMQDGIVRVRCTFDEQFPPEASYALVMTAWEDQLDPILPERVRIDPLPADYEDRHDHLRLSTAKLDIIVHKQPFAIEIRDKRGLTLHADVQGRSYVQDRHGRLYHYTVMEAEDRYYGFGEKSGPLNKRHRRMRMHNIDTIGYDAELTDPLYKHIPFYIKLIGSSGAATGMFYHNAHDSVFDMGCERSGYWTPYSYFCADGGEIDYFFIYGPEIRDVVRRYTDLTGKTILPPRYSLGYMGSTMYYTELDRDADQAVLGFLDRCREEGIPCDGFFLSSGYSTGHDGKRYVFNWNKDRFPDPKKFVASVADKGAALVPNVKPGMLSTHPHYEKFSGASAYIRDEKGGSPILERYWGGQASFVDFTNPAARELWKEHLKEAYISLGITAIWNDNNEYEINQPGAYADFEGQGKEISALRPIMPNMMAMAAVQAIAEAAPDKRPYVVNRAGFAGIQRYAQTWAGDNSTSWKSLKYNIPIILGMGLSGVANQGCDIGGFYGPAPEPELFVRWVQNGIFQPRFSIHSSNTDNTVTEPWMYPSYTSYIRDAIRLRYRLVPYFYSLLYEASRVGSPVMRPLVYEFQHDARVWEESFDFMLGRFLLVANVLEPGATVRNVYLPAGADWVEWSTKQRYAGGQTVEIPVDLASIPMFIRSGAIIPLADGLTNLHQDEIEELRLVVEPSAYAEFELYEDDGMTNAYRNGEYAVTAIRVFPGTETKLAFARRGRFESPVRRIIVDLLCNDVAPKDVLLQGNKLPFFMGHKEWEAEDCGWYYDAENRTAKIKYVPPREDYELDVQFTVKDLISI